MIEQIKKIDTELFLFLNGLNSPWLDPVMIWLSDKYIWIPFYLLLLFLLVKNKGLGSLKIIIPAAFLLIFLADQVSLNFFKEFFLRYRPCHNLEIKEQVHLVNGCGGLYGFVSSHAANTFALAVFIGLLLKPHIKNIFPLMLFWASLISYSRIYLGVHYPADVVLGSLVGISTGIFITFFVKKLILRFSPQI